MAETLSSNIVNYLVWRYLQEAGYGNAALQLSRCWLRDPDTLPFAKTIEPHALIRMLQDGMTFDRLQADVTNTDPRYRFGTDHGRPYSVRNGALLTLDEGIPAHRLAAEANGAVQEPPPKKGMKRKKAKTNGVEPHVHPRPEPEVNGDAMDVEQNGSVHAPNSVNSVRADSETVASEAESPMDSDIPMSTLRIGHDVLIQTEVVQDLAPTTTFIPPPTDSHQLVQHTSWGPPEDPVLLAAGKSILQIHQVEAYDGQKRPVHTADLNLPVNNLDVTALCWHPQGGLTVSAREECFNELGEKMMTDKLIRLMGNGSDSQIISSTAGLVNTLRWNADKELLLSISSDGERGAIKVWKNDGSSTPAWIEFTDTAIIDAQWISESAFVVCGIKLFKIYQVDTTLSLQRTLDTHVSWEILKHDPSSGLVAVLGTVERTGYLGVFHASNPSHLQTHEYPDPFSMDLDVRIRTSTNALTNGSSVPLVLLATCSMSGLVRIWDANDPVTCVKRLPMIDDTQAHKIAFSPDGSLVAAAGPYAVTVWDVEKREVPMACWRADDFTSDKWDPSVDGEFSLGWNPDSARLSIALGNQIAVIHVVR